MSKEKGDIIDYINYNLWNGGYFHDHFGSNTIEISGECFCPAGVTTDMFKYSVPYLAGRGTYCVSQIYGTGISSSGGASQVCYFKRGLMFNVNKDGSAIDTNVYQGAGTILSGDLTITVTDHTSNATVVGNKVTVYPEGLIRIISNKDLWVAYEVSILNNVEN